MNGTNGTKCNDQTGQCKCLPHVTGQICDVCEVILVPEFQNIGCRSCSKSSKEPKNAGCPTIENSV